MIDKLMVIKRDLFDISDRLKAIDSDYFVCYNCSKHVYEVHNKGQRGGSFALTVPYSCLDVRTVNLVLTTRAEKAAALFKQIERDNKIREKNMIDKVVKKAEINMEKTLRLQ